VSWSFQMRPFIAAHAIDEERILILAVYHGAQH
jgi:hypothetical protein